MDEVGDLGFRLYGAETTCRVNIHSPPDQSCLCRKAIQISNPHMKCMLQRSPFEPNSLMPVDNLYSWSQSLPGGHGVGGPAQNVGQQASIQLHHKHLPLWLVEESLSL